jgi:hypothetical protein
MNGGVVERPVSSASVEILMMDRSQCTDQSWKTEAAMAGRRNGEGDEEVKVARGTNRFFGDVTTSNSSSKMPPLSAAMAKEPSRAVSEALTVENRDLLIAFLIASDIRFPTKLS